VTDAAPSRLDEQSLLSTLLERVKNVLQAGTAAVLLLDRAAGQLVATAASGIEEEVRQGVRIPLGAGFANIALGEHPLDFQPQVRVLAAHPRHVPDERLRPVLGVGGVPGRPIGSTSATGAPAPTAPGLGSMRRHHAGRQQAPPVRQLGSRRARHPESSR
jgi:phosphoserine phosphatase RsbU/P